MRLYSAVLMNMNSHDIKFYITRNAEAGLIKMAQTK